MPVAAIHLMNGPYCIIKEQFQPCIFSELKFFAEEEMKQGEIIVTNSNTLVSDVYILKKSSGKWGYLGQTRT